MTVGVGTFKLVGGDVSLIHTRPGLQSEAQRDDQGRITLNNTGPSPRNEQDALEICARLVRVLNAKGETFSEPIKGDRDLDAISINTTGKTLEMQVTRSRTNQKLWQTLNRNGLSSTSYVDATAAAEIMVAIRQKSERKYPSKQKEKLFLVLDAARTPSHTFQSVLDTSRSRHLKECKEAGFAAVWLVGPHDSLVSRLDQE